MTGKIKKIIAFSANILQNFEKNTPQDLLLYFSREKEKYK